MIIHKEEEDFSRIVDRGIMEFKKLCDAFGPDGKVFSGDDPVLVHTVPCGPDRAHVQ